MFAEPEIGPRRALVFAHRRIEECLQSIYPGPADKDAKYRTITASPEEGESGMPQMDGVGIGTLDGVLLHISVNWVSRVSVGDPHCV